MRNMIDLGEEIDRTLKIAGPEYRSRRQYASDPCTCTHPRGIHLKDGGCRASGCSCDVPASEILPFAA
jgi:hypothetical protein